MTTRRKQPAINIPSSRAEAEALVRDYARLEHYASVVRGRADEIILQAKQSRDAELQTIGEKQVQLFSQLKGWWESQGKDEVKGKRSLDVDGTQIGLRLSAPKLFIRRGFDALAWLRLRAPAFIRTKEEVDKAAIIRKLASKDGSLAEHALAEQFGVIQKDEFFIAVAPLDGTVTVESQPPA